jgi:hypothetical protein
MIAQQGYSLECTVDLQGSEVVRQLELVGSVRGVDDEVKLELVLVGPALATVSKMSYRGFSHPGLESLRVGKHTSSVVSMKFFAPSFIASSFLLGECEMTVVSAPRALENSTP